MQNEDFQHWLRQAKQLTKYQKQRVSNELSAESDHMITVEQLSMVDQCPHCASSVFCRWGGAIKWIVPLSMQMLPKNLVVAPITWTVNQES